MKRRIVLLGSTGSIGESTLAVVRNLPDELEVVGLAAGRSWEGLARQAEEFRPRAVALSDDAAGEKLAGRVNGARIYRGATGLVDFVRDTEADIVLGAISGAAGLPATLAALETNRDLALANKESLVMAGSIVTRLASERGLKILPVDSEHSAIFQCLHSGRSSEVKRIILTASGGPFRTMPKETMASITVEQALKHPTWEMGAKITIDSATLMNKALEVIEAYWLFGLPPERIEVVVHPQSIVHSLVEFVDGSTIAQLGPPDMKVPIQYALTFPSRRALEVESIDLPRIGQLTFEAPDTDRFPSIRLAYDALRLGGTAPAVLNAANEVAVELFLKGELEFLRIFEMLEAILRSHDVIAEPSIEAIFEADRDARSRAYQHAGAGR